MEVTATDEATPDQEKDAADNSGSAKILERKFNLLGERWMSRNDTSFLGMKQFSSLSRSISRNFIEQKDVSLAANEPSPPQSTFLTPDKERKPSVGRRAVERKISDFDEMAVNDTRKRSLNSLAELKAWASKSINKRNVSRISPHHGPRDFLCAVSKKVSYLYVRRTSRESMNGIDHHGTNEFHMFTSFKQSIMKVKKEPRKKSETEILLNRILSSPISVGYFMAFCESEYNSEYLEFYLAVEDLKNVDAGVGVGVCDGDTSVSFKNRLFTLSSKHHTKSGSNDIFKNNNKTSSEIENWKLLDEQMFDMKDKYLQKRIKKDDNDLSDSDDNDSKCDVLDMNETGDISIGRTVPPNNSPLKNVPWHKEHRTKDNSSRTSDRSFANVSTIDPNNKNKSLNNDIDDYLNGIDDNNYNDNSNDNKNHNINGNDNNNNNNNNIKSSTNSIKKDLRETSEIENIYNRFILVKEAYNNSHLSKNNSLQSFSSSSICMGMIKNNQIILPNHIIHNTSLRMELAEIYQLDVFGEAISEVLIILRRDIFLRFLKSNLYSQLLLKGKLIFQFNEKFSYLLPKGNRLQIKIPESCILNDVYNGLISNHKDDMKLYNLEEILTDGLLFNEFLSRLKSTMCPESLLCLRMITIFKDFLSNCLSKNILKIFQSPNKIKKNGSVSTGLRSTHSSNSACRIPQNQIEMSLQNYQQSQLHLNSPTLISPSTSLLNLLNLTPTSCLTSNKINTNDDNSNNINDNNNNNNNNSNNNNSNSNNDINTNNNNNDNNYNDYNISSSDINAALANNITMNTLAVNTSNSNSNISLPIINYRTSNESNNSNSNNNSNRNINSIINSSINSLKMNKKISDTNMNMNANTNINKDKYKLSSKDLPLVIDLAWQIYIYFIAKGSAFEISVPNNNRIEIMKSLGNPNINMFNQLELIAMRELVICFNNFKETNYYLYLNRNVKRTAIKIKNIERGTNGILIKKIKKMFRSNLYKVYVS